MILNFLITLSVTFLSKKLFAKCESSLQCSISNQKALLIQIPQNLAFSFSDDDHFYVHYFSDPDLEKYDFLEAVKDQETDKRERLQNEKEGEQCL